MSVRLLLLPALLAVFCLVGCGGSERVVAPPEEPALDGGGLILRAADPNTLQVVPLTPPDASPLTFTGFYGSPLVRLGYVPANSKWVDRIAFESHVDGNWEIYAMNPNGSNLINLTNHPNADYRAAWSPDGTRIAFTSDRDGNHEIYVMNADGSNPVNLTHHPASDVSPDWSPDGTRIAFESIRDGNGEIYTMNADGSNPVNITRNADSDGHPAWSPDGTKIAFTSYRDGNWEVYTMDVDGFDQVNQTQNLATDAYPAWSPDGTKIAFTSYRTGDYEVYVMDADGSNPVNLTRHSAEDVGPDWSPDGTKIAFHSDRAGNDEIYSMNADGTDLVRLTNNGTWDYFPDWSPVRNGRRWLVGAVGTDQGFNPPFGTTTDGAILVRRENGYINAVDIDAKTVNTLTIQGVVQGSGERVVVAEMAADQIMKIREDRGPGSPPLVLIGPATSDPVYAYGAPVVKALLDFNAQTGKVAAVMPLTNKSRTAGPEYTVENVGGQMVLRGDFAAVVDVVGATNRAPNGATEVVLDAATGEVVTVQ